MKPFTAAPLTLSSLTARLDRYGFWSRPSLDVAVARNAVEAVKALAIEAKKGTETPQKLHGIIKSVDGNANHYLMERVCSHGPVLAHLREIWPEILLTPPRPSFIDELKILKSLLAQSPPMGSKVVAAVLRLESSQQQRFLEATRLIELLPRRPLLNVLGLPLLFTSCASASLGVWVQAPLIAAALAVFWLGLAVNSLRLPQYGNVNWNSRYNRIEQLQLNDRLRLASSLVTAYEEFGPVNVTNYHWRHHELHSNSFEQSKSVPENEKETEQNLTIALRNLGIEVVKANHPATLYADYWSEQYVRWDSVEWHDPDQDPAEIIEASHKRSR